MNQIKILEDDQHEKQRGAGWALIAEMSENLARLRVLSNLAREKAPVANMYEISSSTDTFSTGSYLLFRYVSVSKI